MLNRCVTSRASKPFFVFASIAALLASASVSSAQSKFTNTEVLGAAAQSPVNPLGVTLGGEAWVDGGTLGKNLVLNNPGFEATDYRAILRCGAVTADGCRVADAEPNGFWNGAHYQIMSGGSAGATGTVVLHASGGGGSVLALDKSLGLTPGDYFSVEVLQPARGFAGWSSSAYGGGTITAETVDLSPETPGKQALLLSALDRGGSVRLSQELDAQPGLSKLQLNGAYEVSFRAKGIGGNNRLNVSVAREVSGNATYLNRPVTLTDNWAQYTLSFSAAETGTQSSPLQLSFAAAGAGIELDDVSLRQSNSNPANATEFRDEVVNALQELHPGTIRMVSADSDVLTQLASPFARYSQGLRGEVTAVPGSAYGIQEFLELCATIGAEPWITVPTSTTPREMTDLVQYLTGDGSDTWSALRIARGQAEPWTSVFGKIHIELENSTGIGGSVSEPMASSAYASWGNTVFGAARRSAGYSVAKLDLVLSGSAASTAWGASMLRPSRQEVPAFSAVLLSSTPAAGWTPATTPSSVLKGFGATPKLSPLAALAAASDTPVSTQPVVNCPSGFSTSGLCGVGSGQKLTLFGNGGARLSGSTISLQPQGVVHNPNSAIYQTAVNVQAFSTTFAFVPNAWNLAFVLENVTHNAGAGPASGLSLAQSFSGGAGCEGGFYQAFGGTGNPPPNNIFVLNFDSGNLLVNSLTPFYSNVQIYQQVQSPCIPNDAPNFFYSTNKVSTSPVPMNSPATTYQTTTKDTYRATIVYTGNNLTLNMYDVTAGGTCSSLTSGTCFSHTWYNVPIPSWVDGTTAYAGFGGSTNGASPESLNLDNWTYTALSAAANPTISLSAGTYSSTQTLTISDSSSGSIICYNTTGAPSTNGIGGCVNSTLYTGSISVSKGQTIYAVAGSGASSYGDSAVASSAYRITGYASQPTFNQSGGTYQGNQTVQLTTAAGGVICYSTTGSPATNGSTGCTTGTLYSSPITVSSNETIYAVAGGTGYTDSGVGSATYVINPFAVVDGYTGSYPSNSPTYSPVPGTYSGTQSVTLSTTTPGAKICYILSAIPPVIMPATNNLGQDGTTFGCSVGTLYSGPITVTSSQTIYAVAGTVAGAAGSGPPSSLTAGAYVIGGAQAAMPAFSPIPGTYTSTRSVTLTDSTPDTTIYYTTNGTLPTTSSSLYSGSITVSSTETIEAIAAKSGYANSSVASATYTISATPAMPKFSVAAGTYTTTQTVSISDTTSGATIYYTKNGTTPTTSSTKYSGAITVSSTETLEAIATVDDPTMSAVARATYVIESPYINYPSGGFMASSFDLNGGAAITSGGLLQVTDGGAGEGRSAWFATKVQVQSFTTDFTFQLVNAQADGFAFVIQNAGPTALGGSGGGLGYLGIPKSVAIKFDLHNNAGEGPDSTGLFTDGAAPMTPAINLTDTPINLHSGDRFSAHITYDGTDLTLTLTDSNTLGTWSYSWPINISATVGGTTAYVGFTGGTGSLTANQIINSWTYLPNSSTPNFAAGFDGAGLDLNGATYSGTAVQLTNGGTSEAGSAFYATPLNIQSFATNFTFQLVNAQADGFAFVIQNAGPTALGGSGGGLGYLGIPKSVAIKFDLYNNAGEGPDSTGLFTDGAAPTTPAINLTGTPINLHSGDPFSAHIIYDGTDLTLTLTDSNTLGTWSYSWPINISATVGGATAYVGFTGATGGATAAQNVLSWTYVVP